VERTRYRRFDTLATSCASPFGSREAARCKNAPGICGFGHPI